MLHLVNFERLVDIETRLTAEHRIKKGFYDPMTGLKGTPDPVVLRRFTIFVNIHPQHTISAAGLYKRITSVFSDGICVSRNILYS